MFTSSNQLKIDAAYFLLATKKEFVSYITQSFFSGCLEKSQMDSIIAEIDKLRLELLDNFLFTSILFTSDTKILKESKEKFQDVIKNKKSIVSLQEKNIDFTLRFGNMRSKFQTLFEDAYKKNLVTEYDYNALVNKSETHYDMFKNTINSSLRFDIEMIILEKNLRNYFYDIYSFYKEIISR